MSDRVIRVKCNSENCNSEVYNKLLTGKLFAAYCGIYCVNLE